MIIVKEFEFHMAHRLPLHKGKCWNLHGHTYKLAIHLQGEVNNRDGMVVDFGDLKEEVKRIVLDKLDHTCALSQDDPLLIPLRQAGMKIEIFEKQPTAEVMIQAIWHWITKESVLPYSIVCIELWETATSSVRMERREI